MKCSPAACGAPGSSCGAEATAGRGCAVIGRTHPGLACSSWWHEYRRRARSAAGSRQHRARRARHEEFWVQGPAPRAAARVRDRKSTRLNSSHSSISYAVFCLKKKKKKQHFNGSIKKRKKNTTI